LKARSTLMEIFLRKHGNGNKRQSLEEDEDEKKCC